MESKEKREEEGVENVPIIRGRGVRRNWSFRIECPGRMLQFEPEMKYFIYGEKERDDGTKYWRGYVEFKQPIRFSGVKKIWSDTDGLILWGRECSREAEIGKFKEKGEFNWIAEHGNPVRGGKKVKPQQRLEFEVPEKTLMEDLMELTKDMEDQARALKKAQVAVYQKLQGVLNKHTTVKNSKEEK